MFAYTHTHTHTHIWYICEYYSVIKNNENFAFVTMCVNLENIILREVNLTEKDKYDFTHMWNLDRQTKQTKDKTETNSDTEKRMLIIEGKMKKVKEVKCTEVVGNLIFRNDHSIMGTDVKLQCCAESIIN